MTDRIAVQLIAELVRSGTLDIEGISNIANALRIEGEDDDAATVLAAWTEGQAPVDGLSKPDLRVVQLVPRLKLGPDGGNHD